MLPSELGTHRAAELVTPAVRLGPARRGGLETWRIKAAGPPGAWKLSSPGRAGEKALRSRVHNHSVETAL